MRTRAAITRPEVLVLPLLLACSSATKDVPHDSGVVDVGYGTQERSSTTGAVSSADSDDMGGTHYTRVEQMIAARFPGVDVRANSDGSYSIRIRSLNTVNSGTEPLVVIDGMPARDIAVLASMNPQDVQRIDVLRDAASGSIYGSRGGNGVILIQTKRAGD